MVNWIDFEPPENMFEQIPKAHKRIHYPWGLFINYVTPRGEGVGWPWCYARA